MLKIGKERVLQIPIYDRTAHKGASKTSKIEYRNNLKKDTEVLDSNRKMW